MDDQRLADVKAADPFRQQVLLNLLMNAGEAVAATEDGPRVIVIDTDPLRSGRLTLRVRDSGIGVKEPAELERMFENFVSSKPEGLGMVLTISRSARTWARRATTSRSCTRRWASTRSSR